MNLLKKLRGKFPGRPRDAFRPRRRTSLHLEGLETRLMPASNTFVVPVSELADGVRTFHSLSLAIVGAGSNGVVTVEPESSTDLVQPIVITTSNLRSGRSQYACGVSPSYQLTVLAHKVTCITQPAGVSIGIDRLTMPAISATITNCLVGGQRLWRRLGANAKHFTAGVTITNDSQISRWILFKTTCLPAPIGRS